MFNATGVWAQIQADCCLLVPNEVVVDEFCKSVMKLPAVLKPVMIATVPPVLFSQALKLKDCVGLKVKLGEVLVKWPAVVNS